MGFYNRELKKQTQDWKTFLRNATDEQLTKKRVELTQEIRANKAKKLEIQAEVDRRVAENPPDRGQEIHL